MHKKFKPSRFNQHFMALEARRLMCADHALLPSGADDLGTYPAIYADAATNTAASVSLALSPLSSVPSLSSRSGATAKLYLDFDGDTTATWGSYSPGATPAY